MTAVAPAGPAATQLDPENPWPGLDSFEEQAQDYFHGREAEAEALLRRVIDAPLTVLFGKSGLGKTSLLKAGLFPRLRERHYLPVHVRLDIRPGAGPLVDQLRDALSAAIVDQQVDARPAPDDRPLWDYLHDASLELWSRQNYPLTPVLVLDQFEEIFTLGERVPAEVERFKNDLGDLVENRIPTRIEALAVDAADAARLDLRAMPYKVVLTLREDFLPHLEGWRAALPSLGRVRLRLLPMRPEQALSAVYDTAPHLMDEALARRIVAFVAAAQTTRVAGQRAADPDAPASGEIEPSLLSLFCRGLNERRQREGKARFDDELLAGAQHGIIADYYRSCVASFPDSVSRFIETELITAKGFRNSFAKDDAVPRYLSEEQLGSLIDRRLLRTEERYGTERIELTHDVLTPAVLEHRLQRDAEDERAAIARTEAQKREALEAQARQQRKQLRTMMLAVVVCLALAGIAGFYWLIAERALAEAERERTAAVRSGEAAMEAREVALSAREAAVIAQRIAEDRRQEAELQGARATAAQTFAQTQAAAAQESARAAQQQARVAYARELAAMATPLADRDSDGAREVATLLGLQAVDATYLSGGTVTREAEDVLRRATGGSVTELPAPGHARAIRDIAFGPGGAEVATCDDESVRVWNPASGDELRATRVRGCDRLAFGQDGIRLVSIGGLDIQADVIDLGSGRPLLELRRGRGQQIRAFALSADGRRFAANDVNTGLIVWELNADGARELAKFGSAPVTGVAMNANGTRVAYVDEKLVQVVDLQGAAVSLVRSIPASEVHALALSGDGATLAISSKQIGLQVWDVSSGESPAPFGVGAEGIALSADGRRLATFRQDPGPTNVYEAATGARITQLATAGRAALSPDGERLAVTNISTPTQVDIDDTRGGRSVALYGSEGSAMTAAALSADAAHLVTAGRDGRVRLWDVAAGRATRMVRGSAGIDLVAVSPSGDRLAGSQRSERLLVWDAAGGEARSLLTPGRPITVMDMRFLGSGDRLVTNGDPGENLLEVWQVVSGQRAPAPLTPKADRFMRVLAIAVSADEQLFAVATTADTTIYHAASARSLFTVKGTWSDVTFAGRGGEWLAVSSQNGSQVWDVRAARQLPHAALPGVPGPEVPRRSRVALTGDGRMLALVDRDEQTVSMYDARTGARRTTLFGHGGKVRTIAFTADGAVLRVIADDWTIHDHPIGIPDLVSLARSRVNRPLTTDECQRFLSRTSCPTAP